MAWRPQILTSNACIVIRLWRNFCFCTERYLNSLCKYDINWMEIFVTGCTENCRFDNFSQWRKFRQNDILVSVTWYRIYNINVLHDAVVWNMILQIFAELVYKWLHIEILAVSPMIAIQGEIGGDLIYYRFTWNDSHLYNDSITPMHSITTCSGNCEARL